MISTVDIEKYFQKNFKKLKQENGSVAIVAWKNGSLVDCRGKEQAFEKDNDEIIRKGEYDYVVDRIEVKKTAVTIARDLENVAIITAEILLKELKQKAMSVAAELRNVAKKTAKELEKRSFKKIVSEKVIN